MTRVDVHQHLWPEPLLEALKRRTSAPCLRRLGSDWLLHVPGEPPSVLTAEAGGLAQRAQALDAQGVDRALLALSSVLGVEGLPEPEARDLIASYAQGVAAIDDERFGAWGALPLAAGPAPAEVDGLLNQGFVGLSVPAGALTTLDGLARLAPLLARLEAHGAPLFVHPGPSPWSAGDAPGTERQTGAVPGWWPALTGYVAQMNTAWHAFAAEGRRRHPNLRVLFAMLAGLAPLHRNRLELRGGDTIDSRDELFFYDTSSYGPEVICGLSKVTGAGQVVYGSDRPVVDAPPPDFGCTAEVWDQVLADNAARLLGTEQSPLEALELAQ